MVKSRKRFGQHFLEAAWGTEAIDAPHATRADTFPEIGPGRGAPARPLAAQATRAAFRLRPKVTSSVVRLRFRPATVDVGDRRVFERIVRGIFLQRRKVLGNALRAVADALGRRSVDLLERAGGDGRVRPETLTLD